MKAASFFTISTAYFVSFTYRFSDKNNENPFGYDLPTIKMGGLKRD